MYIYKCINIYIYLAICFDLFADTEQQLIDKLQMLVGAYVQLEGAYCVLNVREAIQIAESIEVCSSTSGV